MMKVSASLKPASGPVRGLTCPILMTRACPRAAPGPSSAGAAMAAAPTFTSERRSMRVLLVIRPSLAMVRFAAFGIIVSQPAAEVCHGFDHVGQEARQGGDDRLAARDLRRVRARKAESQRVRRPAAPVRERAVPGLGDPAQARPALRLPPPRP